MVLEAATPGTEATAVFYVHNTSATAVGGVRPHCAPLRSHLGHELAADAVRFDPEVVDPLPPRGSCGIEVRCRVPPGAAPGTYVSVILVSNVPELYLPLQVTVRAGRRRRDRRPGGRGRARRSPGQLPAARLGGDRTPPPARRAARVALRARWPTIPGEPGRGSGPRCASPPAPPTAVEEDDALAAAAAIELAHSAFLVHDDIQDGSDWRRGHPTLHRRVGLPLAVNAGDALAVLSLEVLRADTGRLGRRLGLRILSEFSSAMWQTLEGQAVELGWRRDGVTNLSPQNYLELILRKTCWYTTIAPLRIGVADRLLGRAPTSRPSPDSASSSVRPSRSPTTSSTSPAARPPTARRSGATSGRASAP